MKNVTLSLPIWQYDKLIDKVELIKKALRMVKINEPLKNVIMNDLYVIDGIIKQSKKEMEK